MECHPNTTAVDKSRKRVPNRSNWKRERAKVQRYAAPGLPKRITCNHRTKGKVYQCSQLTYQDQKRFHNKFYSVAEKNAQDALILKYTQASHPRRQRIVNNDRGVKTIVVQYFIPNSQKENVQVCSVAFKSTLLLSQNRIQGIVHRHFTTGKSPNDKRGGDRRFRLYQHKEMSVIDFVKKCRVLENHYCRSKSSTRVYLSSDLNIKKMWRMYQQSTEDRELQVKESYFRKVFRTKFNIGFGCPRTDECSTCISLQERITNATDLTKQNLIAEKRIHKLKAKAFYTSLEEKGEDLITISFDGQKNQVLPRVPDQTAYYSRQIYKFSLTIITGDSKCQQTKQNVFIYHWDETEQTKGSNEIASEVYDFLSHHLKIPENVVTLRAVSDGCGGQNKNTTMMGMISYWLVHKAPKTLQRVEFVFPIVGHSFLPPDRVFARIEKQIKRSDVIITPKEYTDLFSEHGTVVSLAGKVFNWKSAVQAITKTAGQWHFKFNAAKRFFFKKNLAGNNVLIQGEVNYKSEFGTFKSVCKKNKITSNMRMPNPVPIGVELPPLKIRDVSNLLKKHFGEEWMLMETLRFYKDIVADNPGEEDNSDQEENMENENQPDCHIDDALIEGSVI